MKITLKIKNYLFDRFLFSLSRSFFNSSYSCIFLCIKLSVNLVFSTKSPPIAPPALEDERSFERSAADLCSAAGPSEENLRIVGVQSGKATVVLYDILGKQILSTSFEGTGVNDILLPKHISEGVYIVRMKTVSGIINKKINLK